MKKAMGLLTLLMVLSLFTGALAAPGEANLFYRTSESDRGSYVLTAASDGKDLYVLQLPNDGSPYQLIHYNYQTQATEILASDLPQSFYNAYSKDEFESNAQGDLSRVINRLFMSEGELFCLNSIAGTVSRLTSQEGTLVFTQVGAFDNASFVNETGDSIYAKKIRGIIKQGDMLCVSTYDEEASKSAAVLQIDLKTGVCKTLSNAAVTELIPYKDGIALALIYDPQNSIDEVTKMDLPREIHSLDLQTGVSKKLYDLNAGSSGIAYDSQSDVLYYVEGSRVQARKADGKCETAAYLFSVEPYAICCAAYADGLYTVAGSGGVAIRNIDPQYLLDKVLTIHGSSSRVSDMAFLEAYPNIALEFPETVYYSAELLAQFLSASDDIDIVLINMDSIRMFIEKGYCADLSFSGALLAEVSKLYPYLTDFASKDGKLYAVPVSAYQSTYSYSPDILREIGLTESDLPTTYEELFAFVTLWNDSFSYDFPEYTPVFAYRQLRQTLLNDMIDAYCLYYQTISEDLTFSTPLFQSLVKAFEEMRTDNLALDTMTEEEIWSVYGLFNTGSQPVAFSSSNPTDHESLDFVPWTFTLSEGLPALYGTRSDFMFINPNSKNKDEAAAYMLSVLRGLDSRARATIDATMTESVESPEFQQILKGWQDEYALLKKQAETAKESKKADIQTQIENYEKRFANPDPYRYIVTSQALAYYREQISDKCVVASTNILDASDSATLRPIVQRFLDKQITGEQFINEMDKIMRMVVQERK